MHLVGPLGFLPTLRFDDATPFYCYCGASVIFTYPTASSLGSFQNLYAASGLSSAKPQVTAGWHRPAPILPEVL